MNKFLPFALALGLIGSSFFCSCSDDDKKDVTEQKVLVKFSAKPVIEDTFDADIIEGLTAVFTNMRNQDTAHCVLDATGMGLVNLYMGTYNISIEEKIQNTAGADSIYISVKMENISVNQTGQEIEGNLNALPANANGQNFIFSEIFFNGETNSGRMMHPDQYFVVFNPTAEDLYIDGLSVAVTHHLSWQDKQLWYDKYMPNKVPIGGFVPIPGNGKEHLVKAGEKVVVAFTAIDHSSVEGYDNAADMSGADFEIYFGPDASDVDNPAVPNVLITENGDSYGFMFQPRGYVAPLMFKLDNGEQATVEKFYQENISTSKHAVPATETTPVDTITIQILSVPTEMIIDGVQTSDVPKDIKTRTIPETVDRGKILVSGCHRQELAIRKEIVVGNQVFYQDTNNSSDDFVIRKGQTAFPEGWRNK